MPLLSSRLPVGLVLIALVVSCGGSLEPSGHAVTGEICDNGTDDDFDGSIDCADSECSATSGCVKPTPALPGPSPSPSPGPSPGPSPSLDAALQAVIESVSVPSDEAGYKLELDGKPAKNQLARLLNTVATAADFDVRGALEEGLSSTSEVALIEVLANGLDNSASAAAVLYRGSGAADGSNFSGAAQLAVKAAEPSYRFDGSIAAGRLVAKTAELKLPLDLAALPLRLTKVELTANVSSTGVEGRLAGALGGLDLDQIIAVLASMATTRMAEGDKTADIIRGLLDPNHDGAVSVSEIKNSIVGPLLAPDFDTDGDGQPDALSFGFDFSAVPCQIAR